MFENMKLDKLQKSVDTLQESVGAMQKSVDRLIAIYEETREKEKKNPFLTKEGLYSYSQPGRKRESQKEE